jgi:hypothetical protein
LVGWKKEDEMDENYRIFIQSKTKNKQMREMKKEINKQKRKGDNSIKLTQKRKVNRKQSKRTEAKGNERETA